MPGRYLVRARLPASVDAPVNFVYAPGTTTSTQATAVTLEAGADVVIGITAIAVPAVAVRGRVVDAGGEPVQNATVILTSVDENPDSGRLRRSAVAVCLSRRPIFLERPDGRVGPFRRLGSSRRPLRSSGGGSRSGIAHAGRRSRCRRGRGRHQDHRFTDHQAPALRTNDRSVSLQRARNARSGPVRAEMRPDGEDAHLRKGLAAHELARRRDVRDRCAAWTHTGCRFALRETGSLWRPRSKTAPRTSPTGRSISSPAEPMKMCASG